MTKTKYSLVNLITGICFATVDSSDLEIIKDKLRGGSEERSSYFINLESVEMLECAGMSGPAFKLIRGQVENSGCDIGWELAPSPTTLMTQSLNGRVVDQEGNSVVGVRVECLRHKEILGWTHTGPDGNYEMQLEDDHPEDRLHFYGCGGLLLAEALLPEPEPVVIQVLKGRLLNAIREPLPGITVQLHGWKIAGEGSFEKPRHRRGASWSDSDTRGHFGLPIRLPWTKAICQVALELLTPRGETLRRLVATVIPARSFEIGDIELREPLVEWGGAALERNDSVAMYPGVSERPLA